MRIVFIGTVEFSKFSLNKIIEMKSNIVGMITKASSSFNADYSDLAPICKNKNIPVKIVNSVNSNDVVDWISELKPDVIFCFGWSEIIKKDILAIPQIGVVGFHPTLLPFNRGRHPLIWPLVLGLKKSGSTFFFMDEGADSGDILSQKEFEIFYGDDASSLYKKVVKLAMSQIQEFVPLLQNNAYNRIKQNHKNANTWRKRSKCDGIIDFRMNSQVVYNLVRALSKPYVGAHLIYKENEIKVWKVKEHQCDESNIEYGKIVDIDEKKRTIFIKCIDNIIELVDHGFQELPKIGEYL